MLFSRERQNNPVKISINGSHCTMLFTQETVKLKITQSKIGLTVLRVQDHFPRKGKTEDHQARNEVNGAKGTMLFSRERARITLTQSKIALRVNRVRRYYPNRE